MFVCYSNDKKVFEATVFAVPSTVELAELMTAIYCGANFSVVAGNTIARDLKLAFKDTIPWDSTRDAQIWFGDTARALAYRLYVSWLADRERADKALERA